MIEHNELKNAGHGGIEIEYCIDSIVQYNVFDNLMMTTQDFGCVYTYSNISHRDNHIRYNLFKNIPRHNQAYSIYNDGSYGVYIYGNLFYNGGARNIVSNGGRDNVNCDNISIRTVLYEALVFTCNHFNTSIEHGDWISHINYHQLERYETRVKEGEEGYDLWVKRWPILYNYNFSEDIVKGDPAYFFNTINYYERNKFIDKYTNAKDLQELAFQDACISDDIISENYEMPITMNRYFKCPAKGDYSIVSNADDFENVYDFSKFGIQN